MRSAIAPPAARRTTSRVVRLAALATLALAPALACRREPPAGGGGADSAAAAPPGADSLAPDSVPPVPPLPPIALDTPVVTPRAVREDVDTGAVVPTLAELEALRAELALPAAGVRAEELVGSFDDARGGGGRRHEALDIPAPRGTAVLSATSGRLLKLYQSEAGGLMVYASDPSERFVLMYAHLDRYADGLVEGQPLVRGQRLGDVGTTGNAPPNVPHLHFAIARVRDVRDWWRGTPVDPLPLLQPAATR